MRVKTNGSKDHFEGGEGLELHEVYEEVSGVKFQINETSNRKMEIIIASDVPWRV